MHAVSAILSLLLASASVYAAPSNHLLRRDILTSSCGANITSKLGWGNPLPNWQGNSKPDGQEFCVSRYDSGARITAMKSWKTYDPNNGCDPRYGSAGAITRLQVTFDDGQVITIGKSEEECFAGDFSINTDQIFVGSKTWAAGTEPHGQGKMEFGFRKAGTQDNPEYHWLKDEYNPGAQEQVYDTRGGNLIGLVGYQSNDALLTVVPIFSPAEIDHIGRTNVYYDTTNLESIKKVPTLIGGHAYLNNDSSAQRTFDFTDIFTRTSTYTTRWAHTYTGGMTYTIKLEEGWKIPLIHITKFSGEIAGTWEISNENGAEDTSTKTRTLSGSLKGDIPPGYMVECQCTSLTASGSFSVTSDVTLYYKDGSKWTYSKVDTISGDDMTAPQSISNCPQRRIEQADFAIQGATIFNTGDGQAGTIASDSSNSQLVAWASYINPIADTQAWNLLTSYYTKDKLAILVANVLNGPDYKVEPNWANVIKAAADGGKVVLGYVRTGYLGVSSQKFKTRLGSSDLADWLSQIEQDVDKWYELYGNSMGGIFFDEGWPECGPNNIYSDLYAYINAYTKKKHPGAYTVLNPGSPIAQCYEDTMDTLLTFEASYDSYVNKFVPNSWTPKDDRKIWHIIYNVPLPKVKEVVELSRTRHVGFIEVTEFTTPNPYDRLPANEYMDTLFTYIPGGYLKAEDAKVLGGNYYQPGSPNDVQVASTDYTSVTLTWSSVDGAGGYSVFKDDQLVLQLPATLTRARVGMMEPGSSGKFEVRAIVNNGVQGSPRTVTASTQNLPAGGAISNLKLTKNGDGSATYNADVFVPYAFVRLFIAGPHEKNNASAGWPLTLGFRFPVQYGLVNYMCEGNDFYNALYKYGGTYVEGSTSSADWSWTPLGTAPLSQSGYTYTWNVPTGGTDAVLDQFIIQGQGYAPIQNVSSGAIRQTPCADNQRFCYRDKFD